MYGQADNLRFEHAALAVVMVSVVSLYGLVLGEKAATLATTVEPGESVVRAPGPGRASPALPAAVAVALRLVKPAGSVSALRDLFRKVDYHLDDVRSGRQPVPRILVDQIPVDLHRLDTLTERKRVFIKLMLPLVLSVNEGILADRRRLIELRAKARPVLGALDRHERAWLERLRERYGLRARDLDALLARVDMVPPSLAIAQAVEESGWGTSRFVREGNAVFGQRSFVRGAGLVPLRRDAGEKHEVRSFERLLDSVVGYAINLNRHPAYREFRMARKIQRAAQGTLDGYALAGTLERYSEDRDAYIRRIRMLIETNGLRAFDRAWLDDGATKARSEPNV